MLVYGITLLALLSVVQSAAVSTQKCYWPSGNEMSAGNLACSSSKTSMCCAETDACTLSGYCLGSNGFPYRGGCTDKTWKSSACLQTCQRMHNRPTLEYTIRFANVFVEGPENRQALYPCTSGGSTTTFACDVGQTNSCMDNNITFTSYPFSLPFAPPGSGRALGDPISSAIPSATSATSTKILAASPTAAVTLTGNSDNSASSKACSKHSFIHNDLGAIVGIAIGSLVVGASIPILFFLIMARSKKPSNLAGSRHVQHGSLTSL